jgi:3'(2'), 5'-bisphosphate nucleotidase
VNIALIENGEVIGGVVYIPVSGSLFYAYKNEGAFKVAKDTVIKLEASPFNSSSSHLKIVSSRSHMNEETETFIKQFDNPLLVARGSSLKFLIIAEGDADIYPRLAPTMEWDTAAAQIILEESGGSVVSKETGQKLKYNKEILRNPQFIAYGASKS